MRTAPAFPLMKTAGIQKTQVKKYAKAKNKTGLYLYVFISNPPEKHLPFFDYRSVFIIYSRGGNVNTFFDY